MLQRTLFGKPKTNEKKVTGNINKKGTNTVPQPVKTVSQQYTGESQRIFELIRQRRLQMLVHSCLYYQLDKSIVDDLTFDKWARELVDLQATHTDISKQVEWYNDFKDWDGTTGFHLPTRHPWVLSTANHILTIHERGVRNG